MEVRKEVLIFTDWFIPGYKAGGPIRSISNFVDTLGDDLQLSIITSDTDLGEKIPYSTIKSNQWSNYKNTNIIYLSVQKQTYKTILQLIKEKKPDIIYINSMFSVKFSILPLLILYFNSIDTRIILSPRGMLRHSALAFKSGKKKLFLTLFKILGWHKNITFHATDRQEKDDIAKIFGASSHIIQIPNLPPSVPTHIQFIEKKINNLKLLFIGRIHPIKNLDFLLKVLQHIKTGSIELNIYGVLEDPIFWEGCKKTIAELPKNIKVFFHGEIIYTEIKKTYPKNHIFILPTQGENFGHAIFDAFLAGRPVIISNQTPWINLFRKKAGWDLDLNQPETFITAIKAALQMSQAEYTQWSAGAFQFAKEHISTSNSKQKYLTLFS